ncbi:hypothetical protein [Methyloraptor flagellatus]|uniref:Capsule biosynthesis protein n=1 Tax=Methyloraptor flagellatus TaxID=3162530 RepID=A0AAU7XBB8_9HYPH
MINTRRKPDVPIIELKPVESMGPLVLPSIDDDYANEHRPSFLSRHLMFIVMVVLPIMAGAVYYGFIASSLYAAETTYVVRSIQSGGESPIALFSGGQSVARSEDDTHAVNNYLQSRAALEKVEPLVRKILGGTGVDVFHRFPSLFGSNSSEALFSRYRDLINVSMDGTGITTLEVRAYDPRSATELAEQLLKLGESIVNQMNERAIADTIRQAKRDVEESETAFQKAQAALVEFRNRELIVDPKAQSSAVFEIISQLMNRVSQEEAALAQTVALSPKNPQIPALKARIKALRAQIDEQRGLIVGGENSLVSKLSEFEQVTLRRELASRKLASAIGSLERARQEARRQQFYLETIVRPVLPDQARYPRRILEFMLVIGASLLFYWIARKSSIVIAEHKR